MQTGKVICDECRKWGAPCSWLLGRKVCIGCAARHVACMVGKESVTQRALCWVGGSPNTKQKVLRLDILESLESEEGNSEEWSGVGAGIQPEMSHGDRVTWSLAWEVGRLREATERMELVLQDLADQVKSVADSPELFYVGGPIPVDVGNGETGGVKGGGDRVEAL